jgi:hypothetical protein
MKLNKMFFAIPVRQTKVKLTIDLEGRVVNNMHIEYQIHFVRKPRVKKKEHKRLNTLPTPWSIVINVMPVCTLFPSKLML